MNTIALGMMVKDEAEMLRLTLPHFAPFYESRVAIDNGSNDSTVELLEKFGFKVFRKEWKDDYSKGRNLLIDMVKTVSDKKWLLMLDGDEVVSRYDVEFLETTKKVAGWSDYNAVSLPRVNLIKANCGFYRETGGWPDHQTRLIRLNRGIHFRNKVHEEAFFGDDSENLTARGRVMQAHVPIYHYGWCKPPWKNWLRSHNYRLIQEGKPTITEVPDEIKAITPEQFFDDMRKQHTFVTFGASHPLQEKI